MFTANAKAMAKAHSKGTPEKEVGHLQRLERKQPAKANAEGTPEEAPRATSATGKPKADADDCSDLAEYKLAGEMTVRRSILEARKNEHEHKRMMQKRSLRMAGDEREEATDEELGEEEADDDIEAEEDAEEEEA